jgi:CheY-like chemotaxis protein
MGMTPELMHEVFDLFRQGARTLDRSQGGLGIGLTLVRRLVEMHGGRVEAESAGPGSGSTFTVTLPLAPDLPTLAPVDATPAAVGTPSLRILVVDDDPVVAESMLVFLEMEGHTVRSADSGEAALRLIDEFRPQVVLLDIGLPGQDGYGVARSIRQRPGGDALILVAVSGYGQEEAMKRSWQAGFDRHLVKPVDPGMLSRLLADFAGQD